MKAEEDENGTYDSDYENPIGGNGPADVVDYA